MDVCPFIPVRNVTMEDCVECAREFAERLAMELHVPGKQATACTAFFIGAQDRRPRAGGGVLGEGSNPSPPAKRSSAVREFPQRGSGRSRHHPKVFHQAYLQHSG